MAADRVVTIELSEEDVVRVSRVLRRTSEFDVGGVTGQLARLELMRERNRLRDLADRLDRVLVIQAVGGGR